MDWTHMTTDDLPILAEWFRDAETSREMGGMLSLDEWFTRVNPNPDYHLWMIRDSDTPIGCIVLEVIETIGHIGLIVNPAYRRQGFGRHLLTELFDHDTIFKLDKIVANIREGHVTSQHCFRAAGYEPVMPADADGFVQFTICPQAVLIDRVKRIRYTFPPEMKVPDSTELLREDRDCLH